MGNTKQNVRRIVDLIIPPGSTIQVGAFNILAVCGIIVSIFTAFYNLAVGFGLISFFECISGVFISIALMWYTRKTGNYMRAMVLTVIVIFIGLFTFLFLSNGAYYGGVPFFFIFATVFTAFLLNGPIMPVMLVFELAWYAVLCIYSYYYPPSSVEMDAGVRVADVIVCETIVSISLAITMYFQIRVYRKKQKELNDAILAAEEANKAKSDFLAKMSHDIRTPLNTIMATNELIVSNTSSARIREWVNDSNVSGRILLSIIDDMLDLTRIEAGRMELIDQPWDTRLLFDEIARSWQMQAQKADLSFEYDMDEQVPAFLIGDEDMILKVTNNLLSNAVKYTKSGKITLRVKYEKDLRIVVEDTGVGIAPEYLGTIFKPFERGVQDIYRETSGSGLGLAIVKELVDAQGGTIDCRSTLGEGTVFTVTLPQKEFIAHRSDPEDAGEESESAAEHRQSGRQFVAPDARVLVVDDNSFNRKVIEGFLEPSLIQIDDVESGFEALEMIDIKDYDLVLMDLRMPKMDGAETLKRIQTEYPDFHAPVIVLTADIMNDIEEKLLACGFAGFLAKPVSSAKLLETIAEFIPEKVIPLETGSDPQLTLADVEHYQDRLLPYGINLKLAVENNAGNSGEFLTRALLFDEFADENIGKLQETVGSDDYYLEVHSVKSIARGVGAHLLAELAETAEYRKNREFSKQINPVLVDEYKWVRTGLQKILKEEGHDGS